ncbi:MAG: Fpg/Nei family DNA glycosylase [Actinomycetota bacterium]|nr:Fpg/Nei family DNA glycosylase [Actinomycetota bacterium]
MPEGDTVFQAAKRQNQALAGLVLTGFELRVPKFAAADLTGETVHEVVSRGKHLLHRIGDWTLHTHLKMEGTWRVVAPGGRWPKPAFQARAVLRTSTVTAIGFELGTTELLPTAEEDSVVGHLGPDLLDPEWGTAHAVEAERRLEEHPDAPVFGAVLEQRNLAGVGNVYANELCFLRGVLPSTPIGETDTAAIVDLARRLLVANRDRHPRVTTGDTRPGRRSWVYGRTGQPCRRCGTTLLGGELGARVGQERVVTWCPVCQR